MFRVKSLGKNGFLTRKLISVPHTDPLELRRVDLHPQQWVPKFKVMNRDDFQKTFQKEWTVYGVKEFERPGTWRRLLTVMPLELKGNYCNKVFPLPFAVETGAPGTVFLGFKLREVLEELQLLKEIPSLIAPWQLSGNLLWKGNRIQDPFVHAMPDERELPDRDIRSNVIGLDGIMELGIWKDFGDVCDVNVLTNED